MNSENILKSKELAKLLITALNNDSNYIHMDNGDMNKIAGYAKGDLPASIEVTDEWNNETFKMCSNIEIIAFVLRERGTLS